MADKQKMSVEDILAACRGSAGSDAPSAPTESDEKNSEVASPAADRASEGAEAIGDKPKADSGKAAGKPPSDMSLSEILAAARGQGAGAKSAAPAAKQPTKAAGAKATTPGGKPARKPGKEVKQAQKSPTPADDLPLDTSSILAAARAGTKPGPMSKAEAAARGKVVEAPVKPVKSISVPPMPAKPAYAQPQPTPVRSTHRRGFFLVLVGSSLAVGFTTLSVTTLLWLAGLARYLFPNILIEPPSRFKVGFPGDFAPGMVETKFKAQFGVWIVNSVYEGRREIFALKTVCTHLGCTPNWLEAEQKFKCPCHGSGFYKDGVNFEGPAPRPLERYAIRLSDDGQLEIDKSKTFQEELGQWNDPDCFEIV